MHTHTHTCTYMLYIGGVKNGEPAFWEEVKRALYMLAQSGAKPQVNLCMHG